MLDSQPATPRGGGEDGGAATVAVSQPLAAGEAHFQKVAIARGAKWQEASMAALHKKERAQALQILQLRQDLERVKSQLEASQREAAELRIKQPRPMELTPAAEGGSSLGSSGFALPSIPRDTRPSNSGSRNNSRVSSAIGGSRSNLHQQEDERQPPPRQRQRSAGKGRNGGSGGSGSSGGKSEVGATNGAIEPAVAAAAQPSPQPPQPPPSPEETGASLRERVAALEAELGTERAAAATERAAAANDKAELDHVRGELVRVTGRYETRMSSATSLQHDLETRLSDCHSELDAARERMHTVEAEAKAGREEAKRLARLGEEALKLRAENGRLQSEVTSLREKLSAVGGKIKSLSGQADATSAEERSFLRMLGQAQKEQALLERENADADANQANPGHLRRKRMAPPADTLPPPPPAAPTRRREKPKSHLTEALASGGLGAVAASSAPPGGLGGGAAAAAAAAVASASSEIESHAEAPPAARLEGGGSKPPRLVERARHQAAEASKAAELANEFLARRLPKVPSSSSSAHLAEEAPPEGDAEGESAAAEGESGSPRKSLHAPARRPRDRREVMAALDPEAGERKNAIDQLRMRMKAGQ